MTENRVVALRQKGAIDDPLTEILRTGARRLIAQAVEAEFETFLASTAELVLPDGRQRVVRHGHDPVRAIQTGIGPVEVQKPKARDRAAASGERRAGGARLSRPLRLPRRDHQHPHRRPRRRGCRHPPQASQIQSLADHQHPRPGVHAPLPPARPAEGSAQGPLLRPLASRQAQRRCPRSSAASSRPADDATSRPDRRGRR